MHCICMWRLRFTPLLFSFCFCFFFFSRGSLLYFCVQRAAARSGQPGRSAQRRDARDTPDTPRRGSAWDRLVLPPFCRRGRGGRDAQQRGAGTVIGKFRLEFRRDKRRTSRTSSTSMCRSTDAALPPPSRRPGPRPLGGLARDLNTLFELLPPFPFLFLFPFLFFLFLLLFLSVPFLRLCSSVDCWEIMCLLILGRRESEDNSG